MDRTFLVVVTAGAVLSMAILGWQRCHENPSGNEAAESELSSLLQQALHIERLSMPQTSEYSDALRTSIDRVGQPFTLDANLSITEQNLSNRCGSHRPPRRTPNICVYLFTALRDEVYRRRTLSAARTWAMNIPLDLEYSFSMHFFVDPKYKHFVESVLTESQTLDYEEVHINSTGAVQAAGAVPYARLKALNTALQSRTCDWVVVPEDDTYMNLALVASKLSCLDSAGPPRLLGALRTSATTPPEEFVHGSSYVMNAAAVPVLWRVAEKRHLAERTDAFSDVAVAECLREEYMEKREQAFPYQEFSCHIMENSKRTDDMLRQIRIHPEPGCIDWFHKVLPENMFELHETVSRRPCQRSSGDLMERCVTKI